MFYRKCIECVVMVLVCVLTFGCQAASNRMADMTPKEASGFMIAAAMAGAKGRVGASANGELGFGIKNEAYSRSPGSKFEFDFELDPGNVTPEQMKQYSQALRMLDEDGKTEATDRSNDNDETKDDAAVTDAESASG